MRLASDSCLLDDQKDLLERDFVMLKLNETDQSDLLKKLTEGKNLGIPFHAIFDADGNKIIDSQSPLGNIGSPSGFEGRRHLQRRAGGSPATDRSGNPTIVVVGTPLRVLGYAGVRWATITFFERQHNCSAGPSRDNARPRSLGMSRRHRVQYGDAIYHVTSRGVNRGDIFLDDRDRQAFLDRVAAMVAKLGWLVYAFALTSNHFHLFFRTPQPDLCRGMQFLLGQYARRFNRSHRRSGALFEGRFRCQVVENESYFWTSRYVHLNPVPQLVRHPAAWPWSSYEGYCDPKRRLPWVRYDDLLAAWQGAFGGTAGGYVQFVEVQLGASPQSPFQGAADGWILGSDSEHTAFMPAIIQINSGEASLTIGGEAVSGKPGAWLHMLAKMPHSVKAQTPVVMLLLK